jgi:hypothetical protein
MPACAKHVQWISKWPEHCHPDLARPCNACGVAQWVEAATIASIVFTKDAMLTVQLHDYMCSKPGCHGPLPVDGSELAFIRKACWQSPAFLESRQTGGHTSVCS